MPTPARAAVAAARGRRRGVGRGPRRGPRAAAAGAWALAVVAAASGLLGAAPGFVTGRGGARCPSHPRAALAAEGGAAPFSPAAVQVQDLRAGQELQGVVMNIIKMGAFVNIGAERHGLVPRNKLTEGFCSDCSGVVQPGQRVTVWVCEASPDRLILSLVASKVPEAARVAREFMELGASQWLDGRVKDLREFGAFVVVKSASGAEATGLVHKTQIKEGPVMAVSDELSAGQEVRVRVLGADESSGRLSLSMKEPLDTTSKKHDVEAFSALEGVGKDTWLPGRVADVKAFGVFVDVSAPDGGASARGLVHRSQLPRGAAAVELAAEDEVKVRVLQVDPAQGRLELSMVPPAAAQSPSKVKRTSRGGPPADLTLFEALAGKLQWLPGRVVSLTDFGAFVETTPPDASAGTAVGLVHVSQLKDAYVANVTDEVFVDQVVQVRVLGVDLEAGKLSLSMVPPREDIEAASNDVSGFVGVDASQWLEGTVLSFAEFGAFVQVAPPSGGAPPTKGLLHKSQMGNGNMPDDPQEVLEIGQAIQVRVVKVDEERQRIQLSMQEPGEGVAPAAPEAAAVAEQ